MRKKQYNGRYIDMHCHILPGIDDGSQDMATTLKMLKIAQDEGITDMIVTPHYKSGRHNAGRERINELVKEVMEQARGVGININLYPGNEIMYFDEIDKALDDNEVLTLNNTNRALVEFMPKDRFNYIRNGLDKVRGCDVVPVIAHIERYECFLEHPEYASELYDMGVEIQVNAASISGELGKEVKKFVMKLLDDGLVSYVGTDAHSADRRAPKLAGALKVLYKKFDAEYVDDIVYNNSYTLIEA